MTGEFVLKSRKKEEAGCKRDNQSKWSQTNKSKAREDISYCGCQFGVEFTFSANFITQKIKGEAKAEKYSRTKR